MVVAPIVEARLTELRTLLGSMNDHPGTARPDNSIVPFGRFEKVHYARFVILDDQTLKDFEEAGAPIPDFSVVLAFLGDCDGPADDVLDEMARVAGSGLRQIFSFCKGFTDNTDLRRLDEGPFAGARCKLRELDRPNRPAGSRGSQASRRIGRVRHEPSGRIQAG